MKRRNLRTLTIKAAAQRTGLGIERIRRATVAGEIAAFRDSDVRGTHYLLEESFVAWFDAHVRGGSTPASDADAAVADAVEVALDVDDELLRDIPPAERMFS